MSGIKGTTKELYAKKERVDILTFTGNLKSTSYSDIKRIDYCFAEPLRSGYIHFITLDNKIQTFEFGKKSNEEVGKVLRAIKKIYPEIPFKEYEQGENAKDRSITVTAVFGYKEIGLTSPKILMKQKPNGDIYLNNNTAVFYSLIDYEWNGPEFNVVTNSISLENFTIKRKSGKKAKGKSCVGESAIMSNVEKHTNAILVFQNQDNGKEHKISFKCNRNIDAQIKCLEFKQKKQEIIEDTSLSLKGIKELKELFDMGAITQEEFDKKKKQILHLQ